MPRMWLAILLTGFALVVIGVRLAGRVFDSFVIVGMLAALASVQALDLDHRRRERARPGGRGRAMMGVWLFLFFVGLGMLLVSLMPVVGYATGGLVVVGAILCAIGAVGANRLYFREQHTGPTDN